MNIINFSHTHCHKEHLNIHRCSGNKNKNKSEFDAEDLQETFVLKEKIPQRVKDGKEFKRDEDRLTLWYETANSYRTSMSNN